MEQQYRLWEPARWLLGDKPGTFLLEVGLRAVLVYCMLQVALRLMGRRMAAQLTIGELAVVVTLGAAVGVPMQAPERGMLAAALILMIALLFQRGIAFVAFRSRSAEIVAYGDVITVVSEGRMKIKEMKKTGLSHERLYSVLREKGLQHLGQVNRAYAEASGGFSIYRSKDPPPGLPILPPCDETLWKDNCVESGVFACAVCGGLLESPGLPIARCQYCDSTRWSEAVRTNPLLQTM